MSRIANRRPMVHWESQTVLFWMVWDCTKVFHLCPHCPSHPTSPCDGIDRLGSYQSVPFATPCPNCPSYPTVPWEGMDRLGSYQSVPFVIPYPHCPSHPTVPWDGMDRLGSYQSVPFVSPLSIPCHFTMGWNGRTGIIPKCPICYTLSQLYHGMGWMDWDHTKVSHLLHSVPTVHPIPP